MMAKYHHFGRPGKGAARAIPTDPSVVLFRRGEDARAEPACPALAKGVCAATRWPFVPHVFALAAAVLGATALAAMLLPALRASRTDPSVVLRE